MNNNNAVSPNSKTTSLLLCLLGFLCLPSGIHRFYNGYVGMGILYLFTGGLFGIGTIVDLILILTGNFKDKSGLPVK